MGNPAYLLSKTLSRAFVNLSGTFIVSEVASLTKPLAELNRHCAQVMDRFSPSDVSARKRKCLTSLTISFNALSSTDISFGSSPLSKSLSAINVLLSDGSGLILSSS